MNPVLLDFPAQFETKRLFGRAPRPGDGAALNAAVCESIEELRVWMPWAQEAPSPDESEATVRRFSAEYWNRNDIYFFLFDRKTQLVGATGFHRIDWEVPRFEIGYWLRTSRHGEGLATEAAQGMAKFAFEDLNAKRVEIRCAVENEKSAAVARRAGFELESTLRNWTRRPDGKLCDTLVFALTKNEEA
ncbi:N-acetyltransferase [bacterium]|nr:MAG: N-acetyltransferase [bacterium]